MTKEWITAIYDRTYDDVLDVMSDPDQENPKGCWNATDLNRIENNVAYCAEYMYEHRIVQTPISISGPTTEWTKSIIPTKDAIDRILNNVRLLIELSSDNPAIADKLPTIYAATQINYILANQIEYALDLMHNQPALPLDYWRVTLHSGIILTVDRADGTTEIINAPTALVAEDEVVTILGTEYGEYAEYQVFTYWSGQPSDIGLLNDYEAKQTYFTMPYRAVELTANFETNIPRTLTLTNSYISVDKNPRAESGPRSGEYLAGDEIMLIADVAPLGMEFYEWVGTQAALEHITGITDSEDPSTAILTMPDCDVSLSPHYINAGQHYVTVTNGNGSGWYNYKDHVSISASVPSHCEFSHWSGSTSYLNDIYSSYQSFEMGDASLSFTANFNYVYSYNDLQIINGRIRINNVDVTTAEDVMQTSRVTLVPTPPDASQGIDYWSIEGEGSVEHDYLGNTTNTFIVGDGNAIITGHYAPLRNLTLNNVNNSGNTSTTSVVQGHKVRVTANELAGNYIFENWTENGTVKSTSTIYDFDMPTRDVTLTANYRLRNQVQVTINYGAHTETVTMLEKESKTITADTAPAGKSFGIWEYSGIHSIAEYYSQTTSFKAGSTNGTVTATYMTLSAYHNLIIHNGSGPSRLREGETDLIYGNQAPATYEFDYWEINDGNGSIANTYSGTTFFTMNNTDTEITAHYKPIPWFTVTMEDGYIWDGSSWATTATLLRNSSNELKLKQGAVPLGYQFLQWEVYENGVLQTNADDVYEPFAEHTRLRNLLRNITIKATYFIPDPSVTYTLSIERKDGTIEQRDYPVGTDVNVTASSPDQGMEFYKWTGDTAYVASVYNSETYVRMPERNVQIKETYVPEGYIPTYEVVMKNNYGLCCYETTSENPDTHEITTTEHWVSRHHYPEGTTVKIKAEGWNHEYKFNYWKAYERVLDQDGPDKTSVITNTRETQTTLTVPAVDITVEPNIALKTTYPLLVNDGGTSGNYYGGYRADIYFGKENTNDIHYEFIRWVKGSNSQAELSELELYDGGTFSVTTPGTQVTPQYIKMPTKGVEVTATYKTLYRTTITGGTINSTSTSQEYYETGTTINITADAAPTGMKFQYWSGDTDTLEDKYDPTTTLTTTTGTTTVTAVYSTDSERNSVGYVNTSLKTTSTIANEDITMISGEVEVGTIITDSNGHVYTITNIDTVEEISTIYRLTKITQGGNIYG